MHAPPGVLLALSLMTLAACGQSGPLYLPGQPGETQQAPQPVPLPGESAEDEGDDATR